MEELVAGESSVLAYELISASRASVAQQLFAEQQSLEWALSHSIMNWSSMLIIVTDSSLC